MSTVLLLRRLLVIFVDEHHDSQIRKANQCLLVLAEDLEDIADLSFY
jgi:hypothetical protein